MKLVADNRASIKELNKLKSEYIKLDSIARRCQSGLVLNKKIQALSLLIQEQQKSMPALEFQQELTKEVTAKSMEISNEMHKKTMDPMKIATDNRLKTTETKPKEIDPSEVELKKTRVPKYIHIGTNKILTPKEVVIMRQENGTCEPHIFYADKRCVKVNVSNEDLRAARRANVILIVLRTPKKKGINTFAFTQDLKTVMSFRRARLANAMNLHMIGEATNKEHQTVEQFIRSEGEYYEGVEIDGLKEEFLQDTHPALIVKDIKRMIHLYYQESLKNAN